MTTTTSSRSLAVDLIGAFVAIWGLVVIFFGWLLGFDFFVRPMPNKEGMVSLTAFCFVLIGVGLLHSRFETPWEKIIFTVSSVWIFTISLARIGIASFAPGHDLESLLGLLDGRTDRMSIMTAVEFSVLATAMLVTVLGDRQYSQLTTIVSLAAGGIAAMICILQIKGVQLAHVYPLYREASVPTMGLFVLAFVAVLILAQNVSNQSTDRNLTNN